MSGGPPACALGRMGRVLASIEPPLALQDTGPQPKPAGNTARIVCFLDPQDMFRTSEAQMGPAVKKPPALFDLAFPKTSVLHHLPPGPSGSHGTHFGKATLSQHQSHHVNAGPGGLPGGGLGVPPSLSRGAQRAGSCHAKPRVPRFLAAHSRSFHPYCKTHFDKIVTRRGI